MTIGKRIKECREAVGLTQEDLAKRLGVSKGAIGNYESDASYPKIENMTKLFEILKTDANYLFQDTVYVPNINATFEELEKIKKYRRLDYYGKRVVDIIIDEEYERCTDLAEVDTIKIKLSCLPASAGCGEDLCEERYEYYTAPRNIMTEQADFAIRLHGDSMEPTYYDGDILLVEGTPSINNGDIGIFVVNGEGYVKEYGGDKLISHNKAYPDIVLHEYDVAICSGRVIGSI